MVTNHYTLRRYVKKHKEYLSVRSEIEICGAELVKDCRERLGMSARRYAAFLGVTHSFILRVEKGTEVLPPEIARRMIERKLE